MWSTRAGVHHLPVVVQTVKRDLILVGIGEFTTHILEPVFVIGMFTCGTIWVLTHGHSNSIGSRLKGQWGNYAIGALESPTPSYLGCKVFGFPLRKV